MNANFIMIAMVLWCTILNVLTGSIRRKIILKQNSTFVNPQNYDSMKNHIVANEIIHNPNNKHHNCSKYIKVPSNYEKKCGSAYALSTEEKTWNDARLSCIGDGAHLAVIDFDDEFSYLKNLIRKKRRAWLGYYDFFRKRNFTSIFDEQIKRIKGFWGVNQPNDKNEHEDCLRLLRDGLHDWYCNVRSNYICEIKISKKHECI